MQTGPLTFHDVDVLAHQAVDLLTPGADLSIAETPSSNPYVYPQSTGGDPHFWQVRVTIEPGVSAQLPVDSRWPRADALAHLITELGDAGHGQFRGQPFPPCSGGVHRAEVRVEENAVRLVCPAAEHRDTVLVPAEVEASGAP